VREELEGHGPATRWEALQARNNSGSTALHVAAYYGQREVVGALLEAGANPWHRNRLGWHAGHYASRWSQPRDVRLNIGLKPGAPASASSRFSFARIRDRRKVVETAEDRKARLQCDSGISVLGSEESLMRQSQESLMRQ